MYIYADLMSNPIIIILIILVIAAAIGGASFLLYKFLNKNKKDEKPTEDQIAQETMDRYLEDVDDPETLKEFEKFDDKSKNDDVKKEDK